MYGYEIIKRMRLISMTYNAIYTVIQEGEIRHLYARYGAYQYLPFVVLDAAIERNKELPTPLPLAESMRQVCYNERIEHDDSFGGLFEIFRCELKQREAENRLAQFGKNSSTKLHVTIDVDNDYIEYRYNRAYSTDLPDNFKVNISEGCLCLEETVDEAAYENTSLTEIIEQKMIAKLRECAEPLEQSTDPKMKMNL